MTGEQVRDPRETRRDLDGKLAEFLIRTCAPYREDRFATAAQMKGELEVIRAEM